MTPPRRPDRSRPGADPPPPDDPPARNPADPVGALAPQPWMTNTPTRAVLAALDRGGDARFVGGCVRDALLKRPVTDIDIAVAMPPEEAMARLQAAGINVVPTGFAHGTVTAVIEGHHYEITALRVDVETDGRHAKIAFTDDWMADAARRDFTINALSCTIDGAIYDYFNGLADLGHGRVRFVGNARERIGEDVLRLLRFFRFYAHYGRPPPDADALAACRAMADRLPSLSGERVRAEVLRILLAPDPAEVITLMRECHVLAAVLPEAGDFGRLKVLSWLETRAIRRDSVAPDALRRLASLLVPDGAASKAVAARLKLSRAERQRLAAMLAPPLAVGPELSEPQTLAALRRVGAPALRDLALLAWSGELAANGRLPPERSSAWLRLIESIDTLEPPAFPLSGHDMIALGVANGSEVGRLLAAVEEWWEAGGCRADRDACLAQLERIIARA